MTDPDLGPEPAWLRKPIKDAPVTAKDDLFGKNDVIVAADDFEAVLGQIQARRGRVWAVETVTGHNASWRLQIGWPRPISFLDRVNGAVDWPPTWIFESE